MGQLEKYGLYVLCLVIFLILGVTIWGGGDLPPPGKRVTQAPISAVNPGTAALPRNNDPLGAPNGLEALLRPADRSANEPKNGEPKKGEQKAVDAKADKGATGKNGGEVREAVATPAGGPEKPGAAPPTRPTYKVRPGDTFDGIAKERLGGAAASKVIARLNPRVEPGKLKPGQELLLPTAAELAAANGVRAGANAPAVATPTKPKEEKALSATGTYTVGKGDTFERIASVELGSKKRVTELLELNPTVDPTKLKAGQKIKLPKK